MGGTSRTVGAGYDLAGNRLLLAGDNGYHAEFTYDIASRMKSYVEGGTVTAVTFAYDMPGRLQSITPASGAATTYGYDPVSRLQSLTQDLASTGSDATFAFTYNPASQIATRALSNDTYAYPVAATSKAYAVNGLNQYTAISGTTHSYDANGNLTGDGVNSYTYDVENRLISATTASQTVTLTYDPLGRLNAVTGSISGTTRFLYDGDELIREYDGGGAVRNSYVHGIGIDDPLVDYAPSGRRFLHKDHQGSIVALSDNAGNPVAINRYDEYGVPATANAGRFGYTGQIWIPELGLWYYKARVYSPWLGRFLQVDPIEYDDQINLYTYVGNDPGNMVDPDGKDSMCLGQPKACVAGDISEEEQETRATAFGVATAVLAAGHVFRGVAWTLRMFGIGRAVNTFGRARGLAESLTGGLTRTTGSSRHISYQGFASGGAGAAKNFFNKLTGGVSRSLERGGSRGSLRSGDTVTMTSRVNSQTGVRQTTVRITKTDTPTGSKVPRTEEVKVRFDEKLDQ